MKVLFEGLAPIQLRKLADALLRPGFTDDVASLEAHAPIGQFPGSVATDLTKCLDNSTTHAAAFTLRALAAEREAGAFAADRRLELVWTGPERDGTATRDTAVVVRELFLSAERDVLVAGYALYNAREIFEPLCERMTQFSFMRVRVVLNIGHDGKSASPEAAIAAFRHSFLRHHWPSPVLPQVYFDPRALSADSSNRAVMHAKCVIIDGQRCFLTSANLTEAAQSRNIELGVVINDPHWCHGVSNQFDNLVARGSLRRLEL